MFKDVIEAKNIPDHFLQTLEDERNKLAYEIAILLGKMKNTQIAFHCLSTAYCLLFASSVVKANIPDDVVDLVLNDNREAIFKTIKDLREKNDAN